MALVPLPEALDALLKCFTGIETDRGTGFGWVGVNLGILPLARLDLGFFHSRTECPLNFRDDFLDRKSLPVPKIEGIARATLFEIFVYRRIMDDS